MSDNQLNENANPDDHNPVDSISEEVNPDAGQEVSAPGRTRRANALIIAGCSFIILLLVALLLPLPYVKMAPGPTFNTIGQVDGKDLIEISGATTYPVTGNLNMTTVRESGGPRGGLTIFEALAGWLDSSDAVLPRELLYPDDVSGDEVQRQGAIMFESSQSDAVAAAAHYLKLPTTDLTIVTAVYDNSPSSGTLQPRDVIKTIGGTAVATPEQVATTIRSKPIGTTFAIGIERSGTASTVSVVSAANPQDATVPYIGIAVGILYQPDFTVTWTLKDVGGPSAGTMFALGIVDKLTPDDLAGGRFIAGTGTIDPQGNVGAIGGIRQKLAGASAAGAQLFLMPDVHCAEAAGHIPAGLTVVPIKTLSDAVDAIHAWRDGGQLSTCPAS